MFLCFPDDAYARAVFEKHTWSFRILCEPFYRQWLTLVMFCARCGGYQSVPTEESREQSPMYHQASEDGEYACLYKSQQQVKMSQELVTLVFQGIDKLFLYRFTYPF